MTVASTLNRKTFSGDGVTTSFGTSPLVFFQSSDVNVYVITTSTGAVLATLTSGTHYSISGGGTPAAVGTIDLSGGSSPYGAPAVGTTLLITRTLSIVQETDFVNNDQSDADVLEAALDKGVMILQQLSARIDRSFKLADTDISGASGTLPTPAASSLIGWDGTGLALQNYTTSVLALALTTAYSLTLLDDPDSATMRTTLGFPTPGSDGYSLSALAAATNGLYYRPPSGPSLINGYLDWTVSANALTVAIKRLDGSDPSTTNPVFAWVRSTTTTTGSPTLAKITAATSVVVSSGSTLGTTSGVACKIWAVLFDDAGTYRLGVMNVTTVSSGSIVQYPLAGWAIAGSTAEGGAGAADSAQVFYTGTAVSAKAYSVLGYATWESGQATAGTWATAASRKHLQRQGDPLPGVVLQGPRSQVSAAATGTTEVPSDDTIPQNTEGDQYLSQAITPASAANILRIKSQLVVSMTVAISTSVIALFQDSVANALAAAYGGVSAGAGATFQPAIEHAMVAGTSSSTTIKTRFGAISGTGGTNTLNGIGGARKFGGTMPSFLLVEEIVA